MRKIFLLFIMLSVGCKKDNTPPTLNLKTGSSYISTDVTLAPSTTFMVGVDAYSTKDELNLFYLEVAYDGANTARLETSIYVPQAQKNHYQKDVRITTRSTFGTERWVFNINDADGRITKKEIRVTVQ